MNFYYYLSANTECGRAFAAPSKNTIGDDEVCLYDNLVKGESAAGQFGTIAPETFLSVWAEEVSYWFETPRLGWATNAQHQAFLCREWQRQEDESRMYPGESDCLPSYVEEEFETWAERIGH